MLFPPPDDRVDPVLFVTSTWWVPLLAKPLKLKFCFPSQRQFWWCMSRTRGFAWSSSESEDKQRLTAKRNFRLVLFATYPFRNSIRLSILGNSAFACTALFVSRVNEFTVQRFSLSITRNPIIPRPPFIFVPFSRVIYHLRWFLKENGLISLGWIVEAQLLLVSETKLATET